MRDTFCRTRACDLFLAMRDNPNTSVLRLCRGQDIDPHYSYILMRRFERMGLLTVARLGRNKRVNNITLTEKGVKLALELEKLVNLLR